MPRKPAKPKPRVPLPKKARAGRKKAARPDLVRGLWHDSDLTENDLWIFTWLKDHVVRIGYPPSVNEIAKAFGIKSKQTVYGLLKRLEQYGFLEVDPGVNRGIRILSLPEIDDLASARVKAHLLEACDLLKKYAGDEPEVRKNLPRFLPFSF